MGLGKTRQALGIAYYYKKNWPLIIVTPTSVRLHNFYLIYTITNLNEYNLNIINEQSHNQFFIPFADINGLKQSWSSYHLCHRNLSST